LTVRSWIVPDTQSENLWLECFPLATFSGVHRWPVLGVPRGPSQKIHSLVNLGAIGCWYGVIRHGGRSRKVRGRSIMPRPLTDREVFETLLAGSSPSEIQPELDQLTAEDRQAVLCTACYLLNELAADCPQRADEIVAVIAANCLMNHCSGRRTLQRRLADLPPAGI
jgi:hypothetical protein